MILNKFTIQYFIRLHSDLTAAKDNPENKCYWIAAYRIARGLADNPNLTASDFDRLSLQFRDHQYKDLIPILLKRKDKLLFMDMILAVLETTG